MFWIRLCSPCPPEPLSNAPGDVNERLEKDYYPTYIHEKFIPRMKAAGITDGQIKTILVDNPRRLFEAKWWMSAYVSVYRLL